MAESDWSALTGGISSGSLLQGVTAGLTPPNGGGTFVYGFASLDTTVGAAGLFVTGSGFAPNADGGGSVTAAMKRAVGGGATGFSPFLFVCAGSNAVAATAYMLGLSDASPSRIALVKGVLASGVPGSPVSQPPTNGVLALSTATVAIDEWVHLRLDVVVNANGDVVLNVFENDLTANPVTAPVWAAIPGMAQFIDDALDVNTGTAPLLSGYLGFGFETANVTRRGYFDQLTITRQTS